MPDLSAFFYLNVSNFSDDANGKNSYQISLNSEEKFRLFTLKKTFIITKIQIIKCTSTKWLLVRSLEGVKLVEQRVRYTY